MLNGWRLPSGEVTKIVSSTKSRARRTALRIVESNVVWMTKDEVMIAVPIRRPATTIATWVLRRSEEHTSELQSQFHLVCRLLLEKKKKKKRHEKERNTNKNIK